MTDDMYLSLAVELYEKGTWSKEVLIKRVMLYAKEKNLDIAAIDAFLDRLTKEKEYTLDEKRNFLSVLRLDGKELKYGDAVNSMTEDMIEKYYEMEVNTLDSDKVASYHDLANYKFSRSTHEEEVEVDEVVEELIEEPEEVLSTQPNPGIPDLPVTDEINASEIDNKQSDELPVEELDKVIAGIPYEEVTQIINEQNEEVVEEDMPETEEEFQEHANRITSPEQESSVRSVNANPERIQKLKKSKGKITNFFLKTTIVITAFALLNPVYSITAVGGYLYFASEIKNGKFNPDKPAGKAVKKVVETIMKIGLPKEEIEKGGKTR